MTVIINDEGLSTPEQEITYERADTLNKATCALDISADQDLNALSDYLETLTLIRIEFASFADGRGFSLARILRLMGFSGHLRAYGHVISDQYAMARRSGFDDVEVSFWVTFTHFCGKSALHELSRELCANCARTESNPSGKHILL